MTSLLSDQSILDFFVDKDVSYSRLQSDMFIDETNFNVDESIAEFEKYLDNSDVFDFLSDNTSNPSPPFEELLTLSAEKQDDISHIVPDLTDDENQWARLSIGSSSVIELNSSSGSTSGDDNLSGSEEFSDRSPVTGNDVGQILMVSSPSEIGIMKEDVYSPSEVGIVKEEVEVEDSTDIDMDICYDVEIETTDNIILDVPNDEDKSFAVAEFITTATDNIKVNLTNGYPELQLTDEEQKLLDREGIALPAHYPLTKAEERNLKRIRRKIRNKQSAQNSRKRKKEYVDGLENRVKLCTSQNVELRKKIGSLEIQNKSLIAQLKKLQSMVSGNAAAKPAHVSTCALVLALSMALFLFPSFSPDSRNNSQQQQKFPIPASKSPFSGNSRSLLSHAPNPLFNADNKYGVENESNEWPQTYSSITKMEEDDDVKPAISAAAAAGYIEDDELQPETSKSIPELGHHAYDDIKIDKETDSAVVGNKSNAQNPKVVVKVPPRNVY